MSITDCSCSTRDDPIDTWSSCNALLDSKKQISYELPPLESKYYKQSKAGQEYLQDVLKAQQTTSTGEKAPRSCSDKLEKHNLLKKNEHEIALQNFKTELEELQKSCDAKIAELEKNVLVGIEKIQDDVETEKSNFCDIACVDDEKYECLECTVELMLSNEKAKIDELSEQIRAIEKERQCSAIKIFKNFFQIVRRLNHVPELEQKSYFEREIAVYNQTVLGNNKNYEKTKLKFRLSIDVLKQNFHVWLRDVKDDRFAVCRKLALDAFYCEYEKFKNAGFKFSQKMEGKTALYRLKTETTIISLVVSQWDVSIPFPASRFDEQSTQLNETISSTDSTITSLFRSYKFYMSKHLGRLLTKLKKLRSIVEMMESEAETEDEDEDEELLTAEDNYEKAKKQLDYFTVELELIWSKISPALKEKADEVLKIFIDFGSPWDVLSVTFLKQQDTVARQLESRVSKSEATHLDLQQKILVEVPKLREEENISKLKKKLAQVVTILDKQEQKYKSDFEEDCKIIKRATEFMRKEVDTMAIKVDKFLQANKSVIDEPSRDNLSTVTSYESVQSDTCFGDFKIEEIIMHDLELIGNQVEVLDEWKLKLIKILSSYRPSFEKEIMQVVESWQDNLISEASQCLETSIKSIQDLQIDIRRDVYDVRRNELIRHQEDLEKHIEAINRSLNELSKSTDKLVFFSDLIEDFKREVAQLMVERSRSLKNSSQLICLQNIFRNIKNNYTDRIDQRMNDHIERIVKNIAIINCQNDAFFGEMALFSNGGTYSNEELNLAKKEMATLIKNIEKEEATNRITIAKITDQALLEINNFEKATNETLNITLEKLKMQENVTSALTNSGNLMGLQIKQTTVINKEMMDKIALFVHMCENKVELDEVITTLNETISKVLQALDAMKGPFPEIDIPQELGNSYYNAKNNASKNDNPKKLTMPVKSLTNEPANFYEDNSFTCTAVNFPSATSKFILHALAAIKNEAKNYYTVLIYKNDEPPFTNQNVPCENCINNSLKQLNIMYVDIYNFWIEGAICLSKFFESIEMPSIEWYLRDESLPDKGGSSVSLSTMESDPNQYVSKKFNEKVSGFQSNLQKMLSRLQSKNLNVSSTSDESENVQ